MRKKSQRRLEKRLARALAWDARFKGRDGFKRPGSNKK